MKKILSLLMSAVLIFALTVGVDFSAHSADDEFLCSPLSEKNKTCQIIAYTGSALRLTVPSKWNGYTVTAIGDWAFSQKTKLKSVIIPSKVTAIGDSAFYCCTNLTAVSLPDSVKSIGEHAFYKCNSLSEIVLPNSVKVIKDNAFYACSSLTKIVIPNDVRAIGNEAFANCTALKRVTISKGVTKIRNKAFANCKTLKDVYYSGTKEDWNKIAIGVGNEYLENASIHYNSEVDKPKKATITKLTAGKNSFKVCYKRLNGAAGYQVQYSTSKKFYKSKTKTVTVKGCRNTSKAIKGLKSNKKYYVKVRAYNKANTTYGSWSKTKTIITK